MLSLYLVRHGHTVWSNTGGVAGRTDITLSEQGQSAVRALATAWLADAGLDSWHCSPLLRTRQTSVLLRNHMMSNHVLPELVQDDRLVELDFGVWEGMTWQAVHEQYEHELAVWGSDWVNRSPPEGESFAQQTERCNRWLKQLVEDVDDGAHRAMVVSHGGSIRALVCCCLGWPLHRAMKFQIDPATCTSLEMDTSNGSWMLRQLNSSSFL